ncbi:unnamed protein product [Urochloa humidicola]
MYAFFGCAVIGLTTHITQVRLEAKTYQKNMSDKQVEVNKQVAVMESRINILEAKVAMIRHEDTCHPEQVEDKSEPEEREPKPDGWFRSICKWFKT